MAEPIPHWVGKYIGVPFKDRGRDIFGCDCWGLYRIVLYEQFGLVLPNILDGYNNVKQVREISKLYEEQAVSDEWVTIEPGKEQLGDVICFRIRGVPCHIGIVITKGYMLHIERGSNSCFVPYNNLKWKDRIAGFHRPREVAVHGLH